MVRTETGQKLTLVGINAGAGTLGLRVVPPGTQASVADRPGDAEPEAHGNPCAEPPAGAGHRPAIDSLCPGGRVKSYPDGRGRRCPTPRPKAPPRKHRPS
ncbi:hypothetical protein Pta02_70280 [Planobispora takensis]|uniref:Uncharacterized protein n=1 Tax=Planobispora takensis TaxID=1367882 RepID=A0A8J3WXA0_9ACTN|nr:hypothetical protein Pta02_70280 [Planobispora takensis]